MGDSHWYGDYLACGPFTGVRIRICDFPERVENEFRYRADVRASSECKTPMAAIDEAFRKVLGEIGRTASARSSGSIEVAAERERKGARLSRAPEKILQSRITT